MLVELQLADQGKVFSLLSLVVLHLVCCVMFGGSSSSTLTSSRDVEKPEWVQQVASVCMLRELENKTFEESFKELSLLSVAKRRPRND